MGHIHSVYDTDNHFKVDGITRAITDVSKKTLIVQHDHNSERFTFEIPRYIEGHDMLTCNSVSVRYRNGATGGTTKGKYKVTDFQVSPNDDKVVICSWLISKNATKYVGPLKFQLRFECVTGTKPDYVWNTIAYTGITVQESFDEFDVEESEGDTGDDDEDDGGAKLSAPVIRLVTTDDPDDGGDDTGERTPAILGVAILGRTILGDTDGGSASEKLSAPTIRLETVTDEDNGGEDDGGEEESPKLSTPVIRLETVTDGGNDDEEELPKLAAPAIELVVAKLATPVIELTEV